MYKELLAFGCGATLLMSVSCTSHYRLTGIGRSRILIDKTYDATHDPVVDKIMRPYKAEVDSIMKPVVGSIARNMKSGRPESDLSNLLSDILVWGSTQFNEHPDFAVYNMGGIRASFVRGKITYGDVLEVAPFENKICFLTLTGEQVLKLFEQMAYVGGEGVSHAVRLVISRDGRLKSALVDGKQIDKTAKYRIATLDYLAQGNDKLVAFKQKTNVVSPQNVENNVRFIIMDYFREMAAKGQAVDARVEGRIVVE